jgi:DNA repair protein RadC
MTNTHMNAIPQHLRPRERIQKDGPSDLADEELISIVFGHGNSKLDVLSLSKSLIHFLKQSQSYPSYPEIVRLPGMGPAKTCQVLALLELNRRNLVPRIRQSIQKPVDALPYLTQIRFERQEKFAVITLDGHHHAVETHIVTVGLANQSQIHARETFFPAIRDQAVSILVAHNHPSGHLLPSDADLQATRKLSQAGKVLGIPLVDHLIVAETGVYSIREHHADCFSL